MKKTILILIALLSFTFKDYPTPGWFSQNSGTSETLSDVFFINSLTGWAVGDTGIIIKTTNGGLNWFQQTNTNYVHLRAVRFINENTGWVVGGEYYPNPGNYDYMIILKTTNGGTNWFVQLSSFAGHVFYDLSIIDSNTAFAVNLGYNLTGYVTTGDIYNPLSAG